MYQERETVSWPEPRNEFLIRYLYKGLNGFSAASKRNPESAVFNNKKFVIPYNKTTAGKRL